MVAGGAIGRFLEGRTKDEIHRSANQFLCLARHFEQSSSGDRRRLVERHQEVHITVGTGVAPRCRAEDLQPTDAVLLAKGTEPPPQLISELRIRAFTHSGRIALIHVYFNVLR